MICDSLAMVGSESMDINSNSSLPIQKNANDLDLKDLEMRLASLGEGEEEAKKKIEPSKPKKLPSLSSLINLQRANGVWMMADC